jgi:hypothetical protein
MRYLNISASIVLVLVLTAAKGQNSVLVNFGSTTCANPNAPMFSLIKNPLSANPVALVNCDMSPRLPNFFSVFVAYNPKDNKIYIADTRTFTSSRIWRLDVGLPGVIACPSSIPETPTYTHSYVSNNFEFDNSGDLWSLSDYNASTGQCRMDKFDLTTGQVINTRILQFPQGNFPTTIFSGDLCILPNGRMFATLGDNPSRLYEILNYSSTTGNASAVHLLTLPLNCYGIAYLNGQLEVTGTNLSNSCYYYRYAIADKTLSAEIPFQNMQAPIDNTSFTPALGVTKQLLSAVLINPTTVDLTYEIYVRNMGNVVLNDINVTEDLAKTFGAANVSNVQVSFAAGGNAAGLTLNPSYNGTTNTTMLNAGQNLPNWTGSNNNYFFTMVLKCRATNLNAQTTYLNSAIGNATINSAVDRIIISDSSNHGPISVVDPNYDGNASGPGENVPTPFNYNLLPVKFLSMQAAVTTTGNALVQWRVATPVANARDFEIQFSRDGTNWTLLGQLPITDNKREAYSFMHTNVPQGKLFYRIKQTDLDGLFVYSRTVLLLNQKGGGRAVVLSNPANDYLQVALPANGGITTVLKLLDTTGKLVYTDKVAGSTSVSVAHLPPGVYYLQLSNSNSSEVHKVVIQH